MTDANKVMAGGLSVRESQVERIAGLLSAIYEARIEKLQWDAAKVGVTVNLKDAPDYRAMAEKHLDDEIARTVGTTICARLAAQLDELRDG